MKTKQLPDVSFEGVGNTPEEKIQSLIEIEPILVMLGYDTPVEDWNNEVIRDNWYITHLLGYEHDGYKAQYHSHNGSMTAFIENHYKANQIEKFIKDFNL